MRKPVAVSSSGSLSQSRAGGTHLRPEAPSAGPSSRAWRRGAGVREPAGSTARVGAARAGRLVLRGGRTLLPRRSPLGREAAPREPRRPGRERAHPYWSNLAYTAHSAGLLVGQDVCTFLHVDLLAGEELVQDGIRSARVWASAPRSAPSPSNCGARGSLPGCEEGGS